MLITTSHEASSGNPAFEDLYCFQFTRAEICHAWGEEFKIVLMGGDAEKQG